MESTILITILLVLTCFTAINLVVMSMILARINAFRRGFYEFITPAKEGEKSGLGQFVDQVSYSIGHSAFTQVRSMGAAATSAQVRGERAVDGALSQDLLAQANPMLGALVDSMPQLKKVLNRNPGLADYALSKILTRAMHSAPAATQTSDNGESATSLSIT